MAKVRKVVLTLEVETELPMKELRKAQLLDLFCGSVEVAVTQAQANVVQDKAVKSKAVKKK